MKYYKVDIDEEVWSFIKERAEPLTDTVNSVLRRLLFGENLPENESSVSRIDNFGSLDLPRNMPRALAQILEVVHEVRVKKRNRPEATRIVASKYGTAPQTIIDKYCRQLGQTAREIDDLLEEPNLDEFKKLLLNKFRNFADLIHGTLPSSSEKNSKSNVTIVQPKPKKSRTLIIVDKLYSLDQLKNVELGKETRPVLCEIQGNRFDVEDWTDLCINFVQWLISESILVPSKAPILNHAKRDKYFIALRPKHLAPEKDAEWKKVGDYFIDTKYNADAHVKNLESTLRELNANNVKLRIAFREDVKLTV